jgi:hypothetical protein
MPFNWRGSTGCKLVCVQGYVFFWFSLCVKLPTFLCSNFCKFQEISCLSTEAWVINNYTYSYQLLVFHVDSFDLNLIFNTGWLPRAGLSTDKIQGSLSRWLVHYLYGRASSEFAMYPTEVWAHCPFWMCKKKDPTRLSWSWNYIWLPKMSPVLWIHGTWMLN